MSTGISMQGARAPALASAGTSGNPWSAGWEGNSTRNAGTPATGATALHRPFRSFSFFGRGAETRCLCCRSAEPVSVCWRSGQMASRTATAPARGPQGRRRHRLRCTNGRSTGQGTGTAPHTANAHATASTPKTVTMSVPVSHKPPKKERRKALRQPLAGVARPPLVAAIQRSELGRPATAPRIDAGIIDVLRWLPRAS